MKHFYCGRLTEVALMDINTKVTALDLHSDMAVQSVVVAQTSDVTEDVVATIANLYPTVQKTIITTQADTSYTGWAVIVVPVISLPLIQSVLEG